jgi:TolA-binding protein
MKALAVVLIAGALAFGTARLSWAADAAPANPQVEQLQKQLADMQKQMAEMQKSLQGANLPADQRQNITTVRHVSRSVARTRGLTSG